MKQLIPVLYNDSGYFFLFGLGSEAGKPGKALAATDDTIGEPKREKTRVQIFELE